MTCGDSIVAGPISVHTKKSNVNKLGFVMTGWVKVDFKELRIAIEMINNSGDCWMNGIYQTSNDGVGVVGTFELGQSRTADGLTPNAFTDVTANVNGVLYVRFGVNVRNNTGSALDCCWAAIRVDRR